MKQEKLLADVVNFQQLLSSKRKISISFLFSLLQKIEDDYGINSEQYKNFLIIINALDALHHLAKEDLFVTIKDQKTS